jgi:hypothetical protein
MAGVLLALLQWWTRQALVQAKLPHPVQGNSREGQQRWLPRGTQLHLCTHTRTCYSSIKEQQRSCKDPGYGQTACCLRCHRLSGKVVYKTHGYLTSKLSPLSMVKSERYVLSPLSGSRQRVRWRATGVMLLPCRSDRPSLYLYSCSVHMRSVQSTKAMRYISCVNAMCS